VRNADLPNPSASTFLMALLPTPTVSYQIHLRWRCRPERTISIDDYLQIDGRLLTHKSATWINGDFNDDGLIDSTTTPSSTTLQRPDVALPMLKCNHTAEFGDAYTQAPLYPSCPEPASLAICRCFLFPFSQGANGGRNSSHDVRANASLPPRSTHGHPLLLLTTPRRLKYALNCPV